MDRMLKLIFAVSVGASIFAACNKNAGGAKINQPKESGRGAQKNGNNKDNQQQSEAAKKIEKAGDDAYNKLSAAQKAKVDRDAPSIKDLRPLFRDASDIFNGFWPIIIKPDPAVNNGQNIFKYISNILEKQYNAKGRPVPDDKNETCSGGFGKVNGLTATEFEVVYIKCDNKTNPNPPKLASLHREGDVWTATFNFAAMEEMDPMAVMGSWLPKKLYPTKDSSEIGDESQCKMTKVKDYLRLKAMECENIGHDFSKSKYGRVKSLIFKHPVLASDFESKPLIVSFDLIEVLPTNEHKIIKGEIKDDIKLEQILLSLYDPSPESDESKKVKLAEDAKKQKEDLQKKLKEDAGQNNNPQNSNQNSTNSQQPQQSAAPGGQDGSHQPPGSAEADAAQKEAKEKAAKAAAANANPSGFQQRQQSPQQSGEDGEGSESGYDSEQPVEPSSST